MPSRYIKRHTRFIETRKPNLPQFVKKIYRYKKNAYYDIWRPWEREFELLNRSGVKNRKVFVEPMRYFPMYLGDRVEILKGKDKGKQGLVKYIVHERNWVCVEGLNLSRERIMESDESFGQIVAREEPLLINHEVKLVDPTDLLPTDIEWQYDADGNRVRLSVRTGRNIPIPRQAFMTYDYTRREQYNEQPKDTPADIVTKVTFKPESKTFEMDICEQHGIKDRRIPYPMYWY